MPSDPKRIDRIDAMHQPPSKLHASQADGSAVAGRMSSAFEPRLIHPEPAPIDDQGELDLPDDLSALAEQLQDDAQHLSSCYSAVGNALRGVPSPAGLSSNAVPGATAGLRSSASKRLALLTTAAAMLALALSIATFAHRNSIGVNAGHAAPTHSTDPALDPTEPPLASHDPLPPAGQPDQTESLVLLGEASGPEREGLLDLLQQTATTETSISF